jgi:isoleucyl-tRNA synthetase
MALKKKQFKDVPSRVNVDEAEQEVLEFWNKENIFDKSLQQNKDKEQFTFYDGPPYATGKPHYGHVLQSAIKDTVLRYKTMRGYYVPRRVGWDCHGLPVETLVEKEIGFKTKKDIEDYGIEKFNKKCRDTVFRYIEDFTNILNRMGRWADYDNAYATLNRDYMESEWWVFKQLWDQDLIYKAFRSTPYCIRCATPLSNFEVSINYKDTKDTAVYVKLQVDSDSLSTKLKESGKTIKLLIWTTTPWTLPGNAAIAVGKDIKYALVKHEDDFIVLAKERIKEVLGDEAEIIQEIKSDELVGLTYEPLYKLELEEIGDAYKVVLGSHVTVEDGSGLVHIAPAFGEEDSELGKKEGLPTLRTVDTNGKMAPMVPQWAGANIFDANPRVVKDLDERSLLLKKEKYKHSYPFCWRCETPLIYYALDSWFVKVSAIKDRMIKVADQIEWTPKHVKQGRFGKGMESAPDWAISRNRFWSVPMPIWECNECNDRVCVASVEQLQELSGAKDKQLEDLHRPYVDDIHWDCDCGGKMNRVEEVLDAWFDSGAMPYAQSHYPFENKELVKKSFPADFIVEMIEQTRLWFYVLHVLAVALTDKENDLGKDKPAFKNAIASGLIFAEDGRKLSKKLKNYPELDPTIEKYGADVLRLYLLSSASLGESYKFSEKDLRRMQSNTYMTLWNVYSFFVRYANTHGITEFNDEVKSDNVLDKWILARLLKFERDVQTATEDYQIDKAARYFVPFVDDLSNWYVRRSRDRFQRPASDKEKQEAFSTLHNVLIRSAKTMAPYTPFVADMIYRNLVDSETSVHLELQDEVKDLNEDEKKAVVDMEAARDIVKEGLGLRAANSMKVRQPLSKLVVAGKEIDDALVEMAKDEVNVKEIEFATELPKWDKGVSSEESKTKVALDLEITVELKSEGVAREIIRHGQIMRKEAEYALDDRISLVFVTQGEYLNQVFEQNKDMILTALQVDKVVNEKVDTDIGQDIELEEETVFLGVIT